jgi:hypothetical protein
MRNYNTTESNKLLAEFMGYEYFPHLPQAIYKPGWWLKNTPDKYSKIGSSPTKFGGEYFLCRRHGDLRYSNEWNWLMQVAEKIDSLDLSDFYDEGNFMCVNVSIENSSCYIFVELNFDPAHRITGQSGGEVTKLKLVYSQVVEFVKWYNVILEKM